MAVRHMTAHGLNPLKGWPSQTAVDFSTPFEDAALAAVAPEPVWAGSCCHLSAAGKLDLGCAAIAGLIPMPIYTFHNSDDPDVRNDGGITGDSATDDPEGWVGVKRNNMMGLPAAGAYELETTEFVKNLVYARNQGLQAAVADKGKIRPGTAYTHHIVGIVSRGIKKSGQLASGRDVLAFWPYVLPKTA